jgi:adducin
LNYLLLAPVIPINDLKDDVPKDEAITRCKLASLYRIVDRYNLTYGIYNHITVKLFDLDYVSLMYNYKILKVRCPDNDSQFFINALGLNYEEVTASSLARVDAAGNIINRGSTPYGINRAGFVLHSAIHMARPDIHCIIHVHTHAGAAVSTHKAGLLPLSQEALIRRSLLSYHEYDGILVDEGFRQSIARDLGPRNRIMMLHNHGLVACGSTIEEAWNHLFDLVYACETQYRALAAAASNIENMHIPSEQVQRQVIEVLTKMGGVNMDGEKWGIGELEFEAEMRYLDYRVWTHN